MPEEKKMFKNLDPILHSQLRLSIVSILMSVDEANFNFIKDEIQGEGISGLYSLSGKDIVINSLINTSFTCGIAGLTKMGNYDAIIPKVTGSAYITGIHEFLIDPDDPLNQGFILR